MSAFPTTISENSHPINKKSAVSDGTLKKVNSHQEETTINYSSGTEQTINRSTRSPRTQPPSKQSRGLLIIAESLPREEEPQTGRFGSGIP